MNTPINRPPKSKIISIIKDDSQKRFLVKQSIKGKWNFFTVEHKKDKISRQLEKVNTIAEQIAYREGLVNAGTVEDFLLNASSYKNAAEKRNVKDCLKRQTKQKRLEKK